MQQLSPTDLVHTRIDQSDDNVRFHWLRETVSGLRRLVDPSNVSTKALSSICSRLS